MQVHATAGYAEIVVVSGASGDQRIAPAPTHVYIQCIHRNRRTSSSSNGWGGSTIRLDASLGRIGYSALGVDGGQITGKLCTMGVRIYSLETPQLFGG